MFSAWWSGVSVVSATKLCSERVSRFIISIPVPKSQKKLGKSGSDESTRWFGNRVEDERMFRVFHADNVKSNLQSYFCILKRCLIHTQFWFSHWFSFTGKATQLHDISSENMHISGISLVWRESPFTCKNWMENYKCCFTVELSGVQSLYYNALNVGGSLRGEMQSMGSRPGYIM